MYRNISKKIKITVTVLTIFVFVIYSAGLVADLINGYSTPLNFALSLVFGALVVWVAGFLTYGFAQLIEDTSAIRKLLEKDNPKTE